MMSIKVVDSIMGSGKTSAAINLMNNASKDENFIFITPYLNEVERIKKSVNNRQMYEPKVKKKGDKTQYKFESLHELLSQNKNIVATHNLFKNANDETKELILSGNYTLILDEVMKVVEQLQVKKHDLTTLFDSELIYVEDGFVKWNEEKKDYETRYDDIRDMALNNNLIYFKDNILIWNFPSDVFNLFNEVYILTYMFDAQIQRYYYDVNNIKYQKCITEFKNGQHTFTEYNNEYEKKLKEKIRNKINIYEGNLNAIGQLDFSLSSSWYKNKSSYTLKKVKNNVFNYFNNIVKSTSNEAMWTTYAEHKSKIKGNGYTKGFVSCNARATNEFIHKKHLAYTINRYVNTVLYNYFKEKYNVSIDQDAFALSELLQWIWRSAIRNGEEITLFIPSLRMRKLLIDWLNG
ncbi:DEAD/DEAH box helicase family protein [Bacillus paralicheniformis]|uniref:DEAD/DEAH box helicase family protein n=1 Tax=Bacillus paralicheniformis TaxID=1648923 RepID=UPI0011BF767D|nr:DEAD/DEAH box helicase family protein [Bacillus paralicheniformis]